MATLDRRPSEGVSDMSVADGGARAIMQDRLENAMRLAKTRLERDARALAMRLEVDLTQRAARDDQEDEDCERLQRRAAEDAERQEERDRRAQAARQRAVHAGTEGERLRAQALAEAAAKEHRRAAQGFRHTQAQEDEMLQRCNEGEARDAHIAATISRGRALELGRAARELRRQEQLAAQRAESSAVVAAERARAMAKRRMSHKAIEERQQAHEEEEQFRRSQMELAYEEKLARVARMEKNRDAFLREIALVREQSARVRDTLHDMAAKAAVANDDETLRSHLEVLVPRLARAPYPRQTSPTRASLRQRARTTSPSRARLAAPTAGPMRTPRFIQCPVSYSRPWPDPKKLSCDSTCTGIPSTDASDSTSEPSMVDDIKVNVKRTAWA